MTPFIREITKQNTTLFAKNPCEITIKMTETETLDLIKRAQEGDIDSTNAVVFQFRPLAKSIASAYFLAGADKDDVMQIGMIGLFKAVQTFKGDKGASFKTYASNCIRNTILDEIRKTHPIDVCPIDAEMLSQDKAPEDSIIEKENEKILIDKIQSTLNTVEFDVFKLHLESLSYQEIAERLGIERKKVDNTIYSVRKKLRALTKE